MIVDIPIYNIIMPKVGGRRKKAKSHKEIDVELEKELPKIFVIKKGECPAELQETVHDLRKCFYPNTAMKLQDNNKLALKTYIKAAKYYNVTHLVALQHSKERNYIRFIKIGGGEMAFRIVNYCRMKDVINHGGQPFSITFRDPLVVLNNFSQNTQIKMIGKSLQQMFPPINPQKLKPERVRRVICFSYTPNKKMIYFRHYKVIINEAGVNSSFSKLLAQKSLDLSKFSSIGDYLATLDGKQEKVGHESQQKVRLVQMGPRLKLKFISYKESTGRGEEEEEVEPTRLENPQMGGDEQQND